MDKQIEKVNKQIQRAQKYDGSILWYEFRTEKLAEFVRSLAKLERIKVVDEFIQKGYLDSKTTLTPESLDFIKP